MCAKFSVLPQREETAAQMSERGALAVYSERLVLSCRQLVVRRRAERARPRFCARSHSRTGIVTTPLTQAPTELSHFSNFTTGFYYTTPNLELKKVTCGRGTDFLHRGTDLKWWVACCCHCITVIHESS